MSKKLINFIGINVALGGAIQKGSGEECWIQVSPYGDHISRDRKFYQRLDEQTAQAAVNAFNTERSEQGDNFRGTPVYRGHPGFIKTDTDDARRGKVVQLETRNDGLYALVRWNKLGQENRDEGYWPYPSPGLIMSKTPVAINRADGKKIFPVIALDHIGLVGDPNIPEVEPVTLNSAPPFADDSMPLKLPKSRGALGLNSETEQEAGQHDDDLLGAITKVQSDASNHASVNSKLMGLNQQLQGHLANLHAGVKKAVNCARTAINSAPEMGDLPDASMGDTNNDAMGAVNKAMEAATKTIELLGNTVAELHGKEVAVNAGKKGLAKSRVDVAINCGALTEADRSGWETKLMDNFDTASTELGGLEKTKISVNRSVIDKVSQGRQRLMHGVATQEKKDPMEVAINCVRKHMNDKGLSGAEGYKKAWDECKADPANADVFRAIQ